MKTVHGGIALGMVLLCAASASAQRAVMNFNADWRFAKGDPGGHAAEMGFDDSAWQPVRVPHDWAIQGPFNPAEDGFAGKLPWKGVGWYRKSFTLAKKFTGRSVYLDFDGVMAFPKVYVNGRLAGEWDYGYMSFRVDATPFVRFGEKNLVAVRVDTTEHGTRWYPGAGLYRKVTMMVCDPVHIGHWGTCVTTPDVNEAAAKVRVRSLIENLRQDQARVSVELVVLDPKGRAVAKCAKEGTVPAAGTCEVDQSFEIKSPQRWDVTYPRLYTLKTTVRMDRQVMDSDTTPFGIRTFEFTANDGFHLNGRRLQLYGVCLHHDQGPLGAAFYTRAMERQLEIMRDMGVNAIRTSHNPPAPELLDLCDRMGFVVWDEAFDKWDETADRRAGQPPLETHGQRQIRQLVLRDRNHPSVVCWSIGNEINVQPDDPEGTSPGRVKFMGDFVRALDLTRPVGMACCHPWTVEQPILDSLDYAGWNYGRRYMPYRAKYPDKPIIYSESASALSTRGFYELPLPTYKTQFSQEHQVNSYDLTSARWADIPDVDFDLMEHDRFVAGEFVWTGIDYLGEPTPFSAEAKNSYFGITDLCGMPKDRFYLYRSTWRPDAPTIHILPHWNWPDRIGKPIPVFVYTNGDSAELFLNGRSLGSRTKGLPKGKPANLVAGGALTASSEQPGHGPSRACDADRYTYWQAADGDANAWWQADLGKVSRIRCINLEFEDYARDCQYRIQGSADGATWQTLVTKDQWFDDGRQISHALDGQARFVRLEFTGLQNRARPTIREIGVHSEPADSAYYDVTYKYRLRWNNVTYQPGELKAVAYKAGQRIGEAVIRTADAPAALHLTVDRNELTASGEDLAYIQVEVVDAKGTPCPLADNLIRFKVQGPVEIAGVGNGNPLSLEPFQADYRKLFYGKAMLIVRTKDGRGGRVQVFAEAEGLTKAGVGLMCRTPK